MSLTIQKTVLPSAHFNGESTLPSVYEMSNVQELTRSELDEDDELFIGYGFLPGIFPYRMQDKYDRAIEPTEYLSVVLENEFLRAVFLPELGGRMWSLTDKITGRDLLYTNSVVRPCNLAVRNAWLAGGIEFNCGMVGHHPFTCSPLFAAKTHLDDGTPVLRMYEYERIRGVVFQMDFFLPDGSQQLYGRMRIVNPQEKTIPMYWWTNMAVPEDIHARNVINAERAYNNIGGYVSKNPVPEYRGVDITYPARNPVAVDYFWKIPKQSGKYTAYLNSDGYGFFQTSTSRLKGRKLFVWGQGHGGGQWQKLLTADGENGRYVEIQAGLASTQYECLPMPPKTTWEWLEAYGAMTGDAEKIHGEWHSARAEVGNVINKACSGSKLEKLLVKTKKMATKPAEHMICTGSGWGSLENLRRSKNGQSPICPHLNFGEPGAEQLPWINLLSTGTMAGSNDLSGIPVSWMMQDEWTQILEKSAPCQEKYIHLCAIRIASNNLKDACDMAQAANNLGSTPMTLFLSGQVKRLKGDIRGAAKTVLNAHELNRNDLSIARQAFSLALKAGLYNEIIFDYSIAPKNIQNDGRICMYIAFACINTGNLKDAESIIKNNEFCVTDIREGEESITDLYIQLEKKLTERDGKPFDEKNVKVPERFDFRMSVE